MIISMSDLMDSPMDVCFAEYSASQNCFHIGHVYELLKENQCGIMRGNALDYIPFAMGSMEQMEKACREMKVAIAENHEDQDEEVDL